MQEVCEFLKKCGTYYLATVDGDQPRVRPFGTIHIFEDKLYIQTGKSKDVSKQIQKNPKVEICGFAEGKWVRVAGELVRDDRIEAKRVCLMHTLHFRICTLQRMTIQRYFTSRMPKLHSHHLPMRLVL
ncbi:Uncharacterized conserved protein [Butyrivibrio fibrisolvens 16/4]|nr:Uncharacterized conserved protein [Butyrivibrio fibrisolvens 16/4]